MSWKKTMMILLAAIVMVAAAWQTEQAQAQSLFQTGAATKAAEETQSGETKNWLHEMAYAVDTIVGFRSSVFEEDDMTAFGTFLFLTVASEQGGQPEVAQEPGKTTVTWTNNSLEYAVTVQKDGEVIEAEIAPVTRNEWLGVEGYDFSVPLLMMEYNEAQETLVFRFDGNEETAPKEICSLCQGYGGCQECADTYGQCSTCLGEGTCPECMGVGETYCYGGCIAGRCIACDDGKILVGFKLNGNPRYEDCPDCTDGLCNVCDGTASIACHECGGSGACSACDGSKFCSMCGGRNRCLACGKKR